VKDQVGLGRQAEWLLHPYAAPFLAVRLDDLISSPITLSDMDGFHRLGTEGFATQAPEGSGSFTKSSRRESEQDGTVTGANDVKKSKRKLMYRDQM
jgi:hypothetical protein